MKKLSILSVFVLAILSSCTKYNDNNFPGYKDAAKPNTSKAVYEYTLTDADYAHKSVPAAVKTRKYFAQDFPFKDSANLFLKEKYIGADVGALCKVTYNFLDQDIIDAVPAGNIYTLTEDDYNAMGEENGQPGRYDNFDANMNVDFYLINFLKQTYATEGTIKGITYKYYAGSNPPPNRTSYYIFDGTNWKNSSQRTEQFVFSEDRIWVPDPTVTFTMVTADYKMMVDYIIANKPEFEDGATTYDNEEYYYGFGSRYTNVSFRLDYRDEWYGVDSEMKDADGDSEKQVDIMFKRLEEGMGIFLGLKFPDSKQSVDGVQVNYKVTCKIHRPNGFADSGDVMYEYTYKCTGAGTFEYVSHEIAQ
ncbi:MAG: hypothetical protein LBU91_05955 [Bacteroidales bacterium]|jgi:hypothetical protein|nr:hypothetical protein [Bacteroidales bacterium]